MNMRVSGSTCKGWEHLDQVLRILGLVFRAIRVKFSLKA